jgi:hypothetical protein
MTRMVVMTLIASEWATARKPCAGAGRRPAYLLCSAEMGLVWPDSVRVRVAWTEA